MATHSSVLAWRIPWTEEAGGLQSRGSQTDTNEALWHACTCSLQMVTRRLARETPQGGPRGVVRGRNEFSGPAPSARATCSLFASVSSRPHTEATISHRRRGLRSQPPTSCGPSAVSGAPKP